MLGLACLATANPQGEFMTREEQFPGMIHGVIREYVAELHGYAVFLFGSRAAGTTQPCSDFGIGVLGDAPLPAGVFSRLADRFEELPTLYRIDWVDLATVSGRFRREALRSKVALDG